MGKYRRPSLASGADKTREALLAAAGEIFAKRGFEAATVAEITKTAGVNVASVNYHFGDKLGLYIGVFRSSLLPIDPKPLGAAKANTSFEEEFNQFIMEFVHTLVQRGRSGWAVRLMAHELAQPTPVLREVVHKIMKPRYDRLRQLISSYLDEPSESERVRLVAHSVMGQCAHWAHAQPVLAHLWPELRLTQPQVDRIAKHVAKFSFAGLKAMRTAALARDRPKKGSK